MATHNTLTDALKCEQCMPTEKLLAELSARGFERKLHTAARAVVDADQGFRHPALALAIGELRDLLDDAR